MLERDVRRSGRARRRQCAVIRITYIKSVADNGRGGARSGSSESVDQRVRRTATHDKRHGKDHKQKKSMNKS